MNIESLSTDAPSSPAPTPARSAPAVQISGLVRGFGVGDRRVRAVDGIDLVIDRGEIVALLGPNGAGKTTTLDTLLGFADPDEGEVSVLGRSPRRAVADGVLSALLQTGGLLADLTVGETVAVIASLHGADARAAGVMERTGLASIARRRVGRCSGGEQQRVKFALALLPDPDVLVLDEPTTGMDVTARRRFWEIMHEDARAGRTVVFATHYLEEAEQFAQRTVVMNRGRIVADAATAGLRSSLGGRTVSASLPVGTAERILAELRDDRSLAGPIDVSPGPDPLPGAVGALPMGLTRDGDRIHVRTERSDALAAMLLSLGAHDLEIAAPPLETAFTALTED